MSKSTVNKDGGSAVWNEYLQKVLESVLVLMEWLSCGQQYNLLW